MTERQEILLKHIVETYVKRPQPIASSLLAKKANLGVSPATIRTEMASLEDAGLITQPHTSAGRIPTTQGITYYIEHIVSPKKLAHDDVEKLKTMFDANGHRGVARGAAEACKAAVVLTTSTNDVYYTGFSYLFHNADLSHPETVYAMSTAVDKVESVLPELLDQLRTSDKPTVFIGKNNPLGRHCVAMFTAGQNEQGRALGIISSYRTDYARNLGFLTTVRSYLAHG